MGSSEFINCEIKATFLKPLLFKYEILFVLIPPIENQGKFKPYGVDDKVKDEH